MHTHKHNARVVVMAVVRNYYSERVGHSVWCKPRRGWWETIWSGVRMWEQMVERKPAYFGEYFYVCMLQAQSLHPEARIHWNVPCSLQVHWETIRSGVCGSKWWKENLHMSEDTFMFVCSKLHPYIQKHVFSEMYIVVYKYTDQLPVHFVMYM